MRELLLLICCRLCLGDLLLNEYLTNPVGSEYEDECIELWNAGEQAVSLQNIFISDGSARDALVVLRGDTLMAGQLALILDPDHCGSYLVGLPDTVLLLQTADGSFGSGGLANGGGECLQLLSAEGEVLDSLWTQAELPAGCSCERREPLARSSASWFPHRLGQHSLGRPNSRRRLDFEVELLNLEADSLRIRASGYHGWQGALGLLSGLPPCQDLHSLYLPPLACGDSCMIPLPELPLAGQNPFQLWMPVGTEERVLIDSLLWSGGRVGLTINEVMADGEEGADWIELRNASTCPLVLHELLLEAASWSQALAGTLLAGEFLLLSRDTTAEENCAWLHCAPHLNLEGYLTLVSPEGARVEELHWDWTAACRGHSLERLGPGLEAGSVSNWTCSPDPGGSPGRPNAAWIPARPQAGLQLSTDLLLPLSGGSRSHLRVSVSGAECLLIELWSRQGLRLLKRECATEAFVWDGRLEDGSLTLPGAYLLRVHTGKAWELRPLAVSW